MEKQETRILIVDDHPMMREGLAARISSQSDMCVCGEADDINGALAQVRETAPDLAIIDISLRDGSGVELIKVIHSQHPAVRMLVISAYEDSLYAERSLRAGALGYINKQECREKVVDAIRLVRDGKRYVSPEITERLVSQAVGAANTSNRSPVETLSDRELEIFEMIGRGLTTSEIANRLMLSPHTVDSHREKIKNKLKLKNSNELMRQAVAWVLENA